MRLTALCGLLLAGLPVVLFGADRAAQPRSVRIRGDDGGVYGVLKESPSGDTLLLVQPNGAQIEIGSCEDELVQVSLSPSGAMRAAVLHRTCGATVDVATRVAVRGADGEALIAVFEGHPTVAVDWTGEGGLRIHHESMKAERIYLRLTDAPGLTVSYQGDLGPTEEMDPRTLDSQSLSYGSAGRAEGAPQELLLRLAGWSQRASGLYRPAWGTWSGAEPYGDDPRGRAKILEGIEIFKSRRQKEQDEQKGIGDQ